MPIRKQKFTILRDNLVKAIDVDDSAGRVVPTNMNFVEEGFLIKDTGYIPVGSAPSQLRHSPFLYKKKSGEQFFLSMLGTKLQRYAFAIRDWVDVDGSPTFTTDAQMGYVVYNDTLYLGNAVESLYSFNGVSFTAFSSAPKGNILEIFEDRLFVSGVTAEPLTVYYSNVGVPTTFTGTDVLKPLGSDKVTSLVNYYGTLLIFKTESIWKMTFVYDQTVSLFVPKLEVQSGNYGACSRKATTWVENDIWFFTGTEVRSLGFKDQQYGILGVNASVISEPIKQTLAQVLHTNYENVVVFYEDRRFYIGVPLTTTTNDTLFVCHTLYSNAWTKYQNRDKSRAGGAVVVDNIVYTSNQSAPYGIIKWTVEASDATVLNTYLVTES